MRTYILNCAYITSIIYQSYAQNGVSGASASGAVGDQQPEATEAAGKLVVRSLITTVCCLMATLIVVVHGLHK